MLQPWLLFLYWAVQWFCGVLRWQSSSHPGLETGAADFIGLAISVFFLVRRGWLYWNCLGHFLWPWKAHVWLHFVWWFFVRPPKQGGRLKSFLRSTARTALHEISRSKLGALFVIAICCNSFCLPLLVCSEGFGIVDFQNGCFCFQEWILLRASASHQRSVMFPRGNAGLSFVQIGNLLGARTVCLIYYILSRCGRFLMEQPQGSFLPWLPCVDQLFRTVPCFSGAIWGGSYAESFVNASPKRHQLWSNDEQLLQELEVAAGHLSKETLSLFGQTLVIKKQNLDGTSSFSGNKEQLKASQFPVCFIFL